jgi:hypothetical protein
MAQKIEDGAEGLQSIIFPAILKYCTALSSRLVSYFRHEISIRDDVLQDVRNLFVLKSLLARGLGNHVLEARLDAGADIDKARHEALIVRVLFEAND